MAGKNLSDLSKGETLQRPYLQSPWRKKSKRLRTTPHISVRTREEIPPKVLDFFKLDPRTQLPYGPEEKLFYSQVLMHEIDEGIHLFHRLDHGEEARTVGNFSNHLHLTQRLEMIRNLRRQPACEALPPERVRGLNKARNNQLGATKANLGNHPALAVTEVGIDYKNRNEDGFLIMPEQKVLALADGMGGHVAGHIASGIAIDFFEAAVKSGMELEAALVFANEAILTRAHSDPRLSGMHPMGCTFTAIQLKHTLLKVAHVGDTKALVLRHGKICFETLDHTQGQELLREGLVDKATALELNHILNRCLGVDSMRPQRDVTVSQVSLIPGDRVILATDGITDNFFNSEFDLRELAELASTGSLTHAAEMLLDQCQNRMRSGALPYGRPAKCDNLSLAMLEFRG